MFRISSEVIRLLSEAYFRGIVREEPVDRKVEDALLLMLLDSIMRVPDNMSVPTIGRVVKIWPNATVDMVIHLNEAKFSTERSLPVTYTVVLGADGLIQEWYYGTTRPDDNEEGQYRSTYRLEAHRDAFIHDVVYTYEQQFNTTLTKAE